MGLIINTVQTMIIVAALSALFSRYRANSNITIYEKKIVEFIFLFSAASVVVLTLILIWME